MCTCCHSKSDSWHSLIHRAATLFLYTKKWAKKSLQFVWAEHSLQGSSPSDETAYQWEGLACDPVIAGKTGSGECHWWWPDQTRHNMSTQLSSTTNTASISVAEYHTATSTKVCGSRVELGSGRQPFSSQFFSTEGTFTVQLSTNMTM